jgi:phosphatidylserine/phosphatidylglycerophosphate/cardiolipin synthase-like enzyme
MINRKIMQLLRKKTGKDIQGIYRLISHERKKRNYAIPKETAAYILAGQNNIDISRYLDEEDLSKVAVWTEVKSSPVSASKSPGINRRRKKTTKARVYSKGQAYDFYRDLQTVIKSAKSEVWIVDGYLDEEIFNLYIDKLKPKVAVKILTKNPKSNFVTVAQKFKIRPGYSLEVKENPNVHDRIFLIDHRCWVSGQSVKDAGKKPTYLVNIENRQMEMIINEMWNQGTVII